MEIRGAAVKKPSGSARLGEHEIGITRAKKPFRLPPCRGEGWGGGLLLGSQTRRLLLIPEPTNLSVLDPLNRPAITLDANGVASRFATTCHPFTPGLRFGL